MQDFYHQPYLVGSFLYCKYNITDKPILILMASTSQDPHCRLIRNLERPWLIRDSMALGVRKQAAFGLVALLAI